MRRAILLIAFTALTAPPARAIPPAAAGALASSNVEFVANIPDVAAAGGRILGNHLYLTTTQGLRIYDVSLGIPVPVGALQMPNFPNEDLDTDGRLLLIAGDFLVAPRQAQRVWVVDVSNPRAPLLRGVVSGLQGAHTVSCVGTGADGTRSCDIAWTSGGDVLDLRDPVDPRVAGNVAQLEGHDTHVDRAGLAWVGGGAVVDTKEYGPANLLDPPLVGLHAAGWHNTLRPDADRASAESLADGDIDPGELVLGTDENWLAPWNDVCRTDGQFKASWLRRQPWGYGTALKDTFRIGRGTVPNAKPVGATCSSHWFDEHEGVVANGWYEQGVRFLDVSSFLDNRPDKITQIGYYMPANTMAWGALFNSVTEGPLPGLYVYVFDYARGIDVLQFTGAAGAHEQLAPRYNPAPVGVRAVPHPDYGWACRIAQPLG